MQQTLDKVRMAGKKNKTPKQSFGPQTVKMKGAKKRPPAMIDAEKNLDSNEFIIFQQDEKADSKYVARDSQLMDEGMRQHIQTLR